MWYKKQLKRKEQECEELKHKVELMMDCASCKVDEYKKTLTKIKEIAEEDKMACESCSERYTDGCTGYKDFENEGDCTHCGIGARASLAEQILQEIREVENEHN